MYVLHPFSKSDGDGKVAEVERRRLSANLTLTRAHLQVKQREGNYPDSTSH